MDHSCTCDKNTSSSLCIACSSHSAFSLPSMASAHKLMSLFLFLWSVNARGDEDEPVAHHSTPLLINRLYVFGDSNVDPGNSMKVVDPDTNRTTKVGLTADFPPYGIDFDKKSTATGRFSNGKTAADCLGFLGSQSLVPLAYATFLEDNRTSILNIPGINYASSGCGILPYTKPPMVECSNLEKQIDFFNLTVHQDLSSTLGNPEVLQAYLSNAMFFLSIGVNDFVFTYPTVYPKDPEEFAYNLIWELRKQIERLFQIGARRFIVNNIAPLGCLPGMRNKDTGQCNEEVNEPLIPYNNQLAALLKNLTRDYIDAEFFLADSHSLFNQMIWYPGQYGFRNVKDPCCGEDYHGRSFCLPGSTPCSNRDEYLFFDSEHVTEAANCAFAHLCINRTICN